MNLLSEEQATSLTKSLRKKFSHNGTFEAPLTPREFTEQFVHREIKILDSLEHLLIGHPSYF